MVSHSATEFIFRVIRASDIQALHQQLLTHYTLSDLEGLVNRCLMHIHRQTGYAEIVFDQARPVGFAQISVWQKNHEISNVFVHPAYRRRGIARQLVLNLATIAKTHYQADAVQLLVEHDNIPALALYQQLGFVCQHHLDGHAQTLIVMRKPL